MGEENKNSIRYNKKLNLEISTRTSFMNDIEWKYLFEKIIALDSGYKTLVKFLIDEKLWDFHIPNEKNFINGKYLENYCGTWELK